MKMTKPTSAADFKLSSSFEEVRQKLLEERYRDRLTKPLAYWALPNDRRLPLAFLGRTLGDLLATPFDELSATPGIGQKKISSLVKLLHRATKDEPPEIPFGLPDLASEGNGIAQWHHKRARERQRQFGLQSNDRIRSPLVEMAGSRARS